MWIAIAFSVGSVLAGVVAWLINRRGTVAVTGAPTPAETKIHEAAKAERDKLPKPNLSVVHAMSDKELEDAANDASSIVPRRK